MKFKNFKTIPVKNNSQNSGLSMFKFPHEYQLDTKDCGPACVKIIAKYYGKYYSLQYLRDLCGISRGGVSFLDLSEGFEKIGLRSVCIKINWDEFQTFPLPCVVFWENKHFIVVYKITKTKIFVSDPAKGLISYKVDEFKKGSQNPDEKWLVLGIEPMADFNEKLLGETQMPKPKTFANFIDYFKPYKRSFYNLFLVMFLVTGLQALMPFISKSVIDVGIQTNDIDFINLVLIGNVIIIISILLSNVVRDWILLHITSRVNISLVSDYLIKLMKLPVSFFENKLIGDILQRANDHERIRSFFMNSSLNFLFSILTFPGFGVILYVFNHTLCWIFLVGSTAYVLWIILFLNIRKKLDWNYFDLVSKNQSYWVEMVTNIQDIKLNNYERQKRWKWEAIQAKLYKVNQKVLNVTNAQNLGGQFINQLTNLIITFFAAKAVLRGEITFGVMISTQFIIGMLNGPIGQFVSFVQSAQYAKISFLRLNEIHQLNDEEIAGVSHTVDLPHEKSLTLKNVSFLYNRNNSIVLKNISLQIPEGKVTAIVGDSGSGKTTLLKLILRLYAPTYGEIAIGDLNIQNINLKQWRDKCGVVMQDGKMFNDTILNNIVLEDENLDYEKLQKAVVTANIRTEIESLPQGYQTIIGENGRGLSGGQKQRILIARALYKDPDYLFFDEATNALDVINEQKIVESLDSVYSGKTVIVVAHRLSTIRKADQIIVMNQGTILETGTHQSLMEKEGGHYQMLVKTQLGESSNLKYDVPQIA
jgi:ATP-binding cassette subfamily B protein